MKITALSFSSNSLRRLSGKITVLVFVCAFILPPAGVCFCEDCSCPRNVSNLPQNVPEESEAGCCCCKNESTQPENETESSNTCKCGCDFPATVLPATISTGFQRYDFYDDGPSFIAYSFTGTWGVFSPDCNIILKIAEHYRIHPPPVRLHLLLCVLLN